MAAIDPSKNWIRLNRCLLTNAIWLNEPFTRGQAWVDLLMLANHKPGTIRRRGIKVSVKRGEVGMSLRELAGRWKWSLGKIQRYFDELKTDTQINYRTDTESVSVTTLICITNYEKYQIGDTETGTKAGTETDTETGTETGTEQEGKEGKEEKPIVPFTEIIGHLNLKAGKSFKVGEAHKRHIRARWNEGHRLEDFKKVIDFKVTEWGPDEKMSIYLRPETLFGTKFDSYLQASLKPKPNHAPPLTAEAARLAAARRELMQKMDARSGEDDD